ncbi:MAG: T9SS C-terminal target domain-containing protein [bacterium]|nr:T9SS C-terminal target domain-containing protein [bacterium]
MKQILVILLIGYFIQNCNAQKKGCTDPQASNYDTSAKLNDGSCQYPSTSYSPKVVCSKLSDTLMESSGLIYFNNAFWTLNDSGNEPAIYAFDSLTGVIIHRTFIKNKTNIDWEEMTQDSTHIYIGEFGNNDGSRKDLKIYILNKSDLKLNRKSDSVMVSEIKLSYADQTSFVSANQNTNFDMEAMLVLGDSIHLFSKNWVDNKTRHYVLSAKPGTYVLNPRESMDIGGIITSACINAEGNKIILGGYNTSSSACFMWMLWDYAGHSFFSGNKRKIDLGNALSFGQYEATCYKGNHLYVSNEKRFTNASLRRVEVQQWFAGYRKISFLTPSKLLIYQWCNELVIETKTSTGVLKLYNAIGTCVITHKISNASTRIDISHLNTGVYTIDVNGIIQKVLLEK